LSGPSPHYRPDFPAEFLEHARDLIRRRTARAHLRQRARLALLLHDQPAVSNVEAGLLVELHPNAVRRWRRRWAQGQFALDDQPGRGRKPSFSPAGSVRRRRPRV